MNLSVAPEVDLVISPDRPNTMLLNMFKEPSSDPTENVSIPNETTKPRSFMATAKRFLPQDTAPGRKHGEAKRSSQSICFVREYPGCTAKFDTKRTETATSGSSIRRKKDFAVHW